MEETEAGGWLEHWDFLQAKQHSKSLSQKCKGRINLISYSLHGCFLYIFLIYLFKFGYKHCIWLICLFFFFSFSPFFPLVIYWRTFHPLDSSDRTPLASCCSHLSGKPAVRGRCLFSWTLALTVPQMATIASCQNSSLISGSVTLSRPTHLWDSSLVSVCPTDFSSCCPSFLT